MKKALIVGLNNYPGCNLHWCDNDAIAMASLMEANGMAFDLKASLHDLVKMKVSIIALWLIKIRNIF